ncbi:MAG: GNAT family N-acetyltransferase [Candidatus Eremiobacterota bacterium]
MIKIKPALPENSEEVSLMIDALFKEIGHIMPDFGGKHINNLYKDLLNKIKIFIAIDESDKPAGIITVTESAGFYAKGYYGVINELYVLPEYRSQGTGKLLIDEVKKLAESKSWTRLEVTTPDRSHRDRTVKFYEKEGFIEIGPRLKFELY